MKIIVIINLAFVSVLVVAGKKFEAIEGQNATISFDIDEVEKADEVRISFKEDKKEYSVLLAQKPWVYDDPPDPAVTLILGEGYLSVIIQNISISRSGLYKAETYTREKVCEETATLVVNSESGWSKLWTSYKKHLCNTENSQCVTTGDMKSFLDSEGIPYRNYELLSQMDITESFTEGDPLGELMLDFLTEVREFSRNAPKHLKKEVLDLLRHPDCSEEVDGRILFNNNTGVLVLKP